MDCTKFSYLVLLSLLFAGCYSQQHPLPKSDMKLVSSAFDNNGIIPEKYTCEGIDVNPPLHIDSIPDGTESIAIIVDDPDAPLGTFTHWIAWNIPPALTDIPENATLDYEGTNDFGSVGYGGPCPPRNSQHTYYFKVYALNTSLTIGNGTS
ncbi:MAG: YbhB/YbcL family Raf kinase inhibitor-like protein, partial [Candidatus Micrarchaeia archaeon]